MFSLDTASKIFVLSLVVLLSLAGCLKTEGGKDDVANDEGPVKTIKEFAYNATENLLIAQNLPSYTQFARNFSSELKESLSESDFNDFLELVKQKHGLYSRNSSKQYLREVQENPDGTVTFIIDSKFAAEGHADTKKVPFRITYALINEEPKIISLILDDIEIKP